MSFCLFDSKRLKDSLLYPAKELRHNTNWPLDVSLTIVTHVSNKERHSKRS